MALAWSADIEYSPAPPALTARGRIAIHVRVQVRIGQSRGVQLAMADFKTHITTSTLFGVGYAAAGYVGGFSLDACLLAGGICSVSGILPDLDSNSGIPLRETIAFSAAVVPLLMLDRFRELGMSHECMVLAGGLVYVAIRFGVAEIFKRYTVHRGMWHSLPAAVTICLLTFLACSSADMSVRWFKAVAALLGFLAHLSLDELYSVQIRRGRLRLKRSFGTAIKLWGNSGWANFTTYAKLILVAALAFEDPYLMDQIRQWRLDTHEGHQQMVQQLWERGQKLMR